MLHSRISLPKPNALSATVQWRSVATLLAYAAPTSTARVRRRLLFVAHAHRAQASPPLEAHWLCSHHGLHQPPHHPIPFPALFFFFPYHATLCLPPYTPNLPWPASASEAIRTAVEKTPANSPGSMAPISAVLPEVWLPLTGGASVRLELTRRDTRKGSISADAAEENGVAAGEESPWKLRKQP